jgi:predicted acetylornithine/succinylornithine family transaminase
MSRHSNPQGAGARGKADWMEMEKRYYMFTVRRQPVVIVRGEGTRVWDVDGKEYLDFTAGWAVNNLGHCHPAITQAIVEQAGTILQTSNQFYTTPQLLLAQLLVENSCLDKVFFSNSGAEAVEGVTKLARKHGKKNRDGAYEVITALSSFHGRTLGMIAATGQPHYQEAWKPLAPGFVHVAYNNVEAAMEATTSRTAAVLLEPVQGEGGVNVPSDDYLPRVREWCDRQGLLLVLDEVQTGMGRLGTLFGYQQFGVEPDAIALGKGLGGGVPIGAFMSKDACMSLEPGDHGSTFGGNPLTTAAAYASTRYIIENDVPANARVMGQRLMGALGGLRSRFGFITDVRGKGLLVALEFSSDMAAKVVAQCNQEGLLLNPVRPNAIRFMPPLNVTAQEVDGGVARLESALKKL